MKVFETPQITLYQGNCADIMRSLPSDSVDCVVTSPPYFGLRSYLSIDHPNKASEIGCEPTMQEYIANLVSVFAEVRRILKPTGTAWLNLGDSYSTHRSGETSGWIKSHPGRPHRASQESRCDSELPEKNLMLIPHRVAIALQDDGWWIRSDNVWAKRNPLPEPVKDRTARSHEYVFQLTKSKKYYFDVDAIKEPVAPSTLGRGKVDFGGAKGRNYKPTKDDPNFRNGSEQWGRTFDYTESCKNGRNKRSVWEITTKPYPEAHFATMPPEIPRICISAGCPPEGIVLDPFAGSGTTLEIAKELGRRAIGIELNPDYCDLIAQRCQQMTLWGLAHV